MHDDPLHAADVAGLAQVLREDRLVRDLLDDARLRRRHLADERHPDGVLAVRDRGDLEERVQLARVHIPVRLAERPFLLELLRIDIALEDDLGLGRHLERHGLAAHQADRRAGEAAGDRELVDPVGHLLHGRVADDRRPTDDECGGQVLALLPRLLPVDVHVLPEPRREDADAVGGLDLPAVVPLVAHAGLGILGEPVGARGVRAVVEAGRRDRDRELRGPALFEEGVADVDFFVDRAVLDDHWGDPIREGILPTRGDLVRLAAEPGRVHVLRRREHSHADAEP